MTIKHVGERTVTWEARERSFISNTTQHHGPELSSSNIIGTASYPGHGRVLQSSHRVHPFHWSPTLVASAARSPLTPQLGSQHYSIRRKIHHRPFCHFQLSYNKMSPHTKIPKGVLLTCKVFIIWDVRSWPLVVGGKIFFNSALTLCLWICRRQSRYCWTVPKILYSITWSQSIHNCTKHCLSLLPYNMEGYRTC